MLRIFEKKVFGGCKSQIFFYWSQNAGGGRLGDVTEAGRQFRGVWRSFCKSGGSDVIFAGIMAPLHPLLLQSLQCRWNAQQCTG